MSQIPDPLPVGYVVGGRYTIQAELPPQEMGRLYQASVVFPDGHQEAVALNVLAPELRNAEGIRSFRWAVRKASYEDRGHVYDYVEDHELGVYFVVIEYAKGAPILDVAGES